jgi:hypothetical protein
MGKNKEYKQKSIDQIVMEITNEADKNMYKANQVVKISLSKL